MDKSAAAEIALQLLQAREKTAPVERPSIRHGISLDDGYQIAGEMIRRRLSAGDGIRGAKLGFTTPAVWPSVGLTGPLWAPVFESTYTESAEVVLPPMRAPEVEPEVVFG
ncbi:MAG TPA: hypothetical protein VLK85_29065, partial [Ramlibacter sp.]|nr:hypothetical protein [Ramlibacter sp.]